MSLGYTSTCRHGRVARRSRPGGAPTPSGGRMAPDRLRARSRVRPSSRSRRWSIAREASHPTARKPRPRQTRAVATTGYALPYPTTWPYHARRKPTPCRAQLSVGVDHGSENAEEKPLPAHRSQLGGLGSIYVAGFAASDQTDLPAQPAPQGEKHSPSAGRTPRGFSSRDACDSSGRYHRDLGRTAQRDRRH